MSLSGQSRRLSDVGMSASSPTTDVLLRRSEPTLWAKNRHDRNSYRDIKRRFNRDCLPCLINLLLGAGFSKNSGGLLASEVFNDLLSADELDEFTRNLLYRANEPKGGGFEAVLAKLQGATDAENVKRYNTLISVLAGIFNAMGQAYMQRQFEFSGQPDAQRSITPFLGVSPQYLRPTKILFLSRNTSRPATFNDQRICRESNS